MDTHVSIRKLLENTAERAIRYVEGLPSRSVAPTEEAIRALKGLHAPMPEDSTSPESVLETLDTLGSPATMAMAGPRFFGLVVGGSLPASLAANWMVSAWAGRIGALTVPHTSGLEDGNIATMQKAPANSCPERDSPSVPRPPHGLLWAQVTLAIVAVFVGISEVNPLFSWAQWLMPIVIFIGPALMTLPFVITAICVRRRVSSIRTTAALVVSISLTVVAIWGMLPLVQ